MKKYFLIGLMICSGLIFSACTVTPPAGSDVHGSINHAIMNGLYNNQKIQKKQQQKPKLPSYLNNALSQGLSVDLPGATKVKQRRFNISVNAVPAKDFFAGLVKDSKYSIMVSPKVDGDISLSLKNVTIPEVLDAVRDVYGYEYQKTAYGFKILPRELETRMFTVNYLNVSRDGKSDTTISSGQISSKVSGTGDNNAATTTQTKPSSSVETTSKSDFWKSLSDTLTAIVSSAKDAKVIVNPSAGIVIVRAYPHQLRDVAKYLDSIQNTMTREVIIEAKVLEVELKAQYQAGINWNILGLRQDGYQSFPGDDNVGVKAFSSIFKLNISHGGDFSTFINLLNNQGKVNVLSSPRISTLNNQKAVIKVGEDRFFVTNIESNTTNNTTTTTGETSQDIDFTPFFSGIALDVTPEIDANGDVTLHIHPLVSNVQDETRTFTVSGKEQVIPLAKSDVRESDSIVRAKNGQVIVIGGLMEDKSADYQASVPGADKLPGIKSLTKSPNNSSSKFELIILLRPVVVGSDTWVNTLKKSAQRVRGLNGDFSYKAHIDKTQLQ